MAHYYQSAPYTRLFTLVSSTDHISAVTGVTPTTIISKAGASFIYCDVAAVEIANGFYHLPMTTTTTNTIGDLGFHVTATGADPRDWIDQVLAGMQVATILQSVKNDVVSQIWATPVRDVTSVSSPVGVASNYDKGNYTISTVGARGVADELLGRNVGGGSSTGRLVKEALYVLRNKVDLLGGVVYAVDDSTVSWTFTVASDSSTDRVISVDPA